MADLEHCVSWLCDYMTIMWTGVLVFVEVSFICCNLEGDTLDLIRPSGGNSEGIHSVYIDPGGCLFRWGGDEEIA